MKERPILFNGAMVRAILEGRKTQTRRIMVSLPAWHKWAYKPGDRLWVRETWHCDNPEAAQDIMSRGEGLYYRATEEHPEIISKWKPSIFMPRWASRITLEITNVRVDRLRNMTQIDAVKEGMPDAEGKEVALFEGLWDSINGKKYPWSSNPWVWVVSFRRVR